MKRAKVSELKARLSSYLAEVRNGETVIVCDRATPIARLVPFEERMEEFRVEEPSRPLPDLRELPRVPLRKRVDVVKVLRDSRDQR